ncbi:MAG: hypothetical protein IJ794_10830, partial [Lachnospiraceae bacterium]|nr:hypothetical protein [Lachnospiraceae bacterium]
MTEKEQLYHVPELDEVPEVFHNSILDALETIEEQETEGESSRREVGNSEADRRTADNVINKTGRRLRNMARGKLTIPLAATIFILVSGVTAYGAFVSYKERMAQMDQAEIET